MSRKQGSLLFHPEAGLSRTMLTVVVNGRRYSPSSERTTASWDLSGPPTVEIRWQAGAFEITERLRIQEGVSSLLRDVAISPAPGSHVQIECALYANPLFFDEFSTRPHGALHAAGYSSLDVYSVPSGVPFERFLTIDVAENVGDVACTIVYDIEAVGTHEFSMYPGESPFTGVASPPATRIAPGFHNAITHTSQADRPPSLAARIDEVFHVSAASLRAAVSRLGKFDASVWQYDFEWGMDAAMVATAAASAGMFDLARAVLKNILERLSNAEGMIAEASRFRGGPMSELNGNGAVLDALWHYWRWSGDETLLQVHWNRISAIAEYPLRDEFAHHSGLLRTCRDFWERTSWMGVGDGFELAHQVWCGVGLRRVAEIAESLGRRDEAARWRTAGDRIVRAMIDDPEWRLIEGGRMIRRRNVDGRVQRELQPGIHATAPEYAPYMAESEDTRARPWEPCVTEIIPIVYGLLDPSGAVARATLDHVEELWDPTGIGGYARYNIESDPDSPGPWPFATAFVAAAQIEARMDERAQRTITWLLDRAGPGISWHEYIGPRASPPLPPVGIVVWAWAQFMLLVVKHIVGVRVSGREIRVTPKLVGTEHTVRFGQHTIHITVRGLERATIDGAPLELDGRTARVALPLEHNHILEFH